MTKDTIYIDLDDEITTITDKVQNSKEKLIALVLPKHCIVLQSAVNVKILNKIAKDNSKNIVLITTEPSVLALAGAAGMYVAKNLQSEPYKPEVKDSEKTVETIKESEEADTNTELDETKPIGALAIAAGMDLDDDTPIEIDNDATSNKESNKGKDKTKDKSDKKLRVPNFDKFRLWLIVGITGVILLIGGIVFAAKVLPKANVEITVQSQEVPVTLVATGSLTSETVDLENKIVPAELKTIQQTVTKTFTATGEINKGNKATGTMKIVNCTDPTLTVPAGTTFTNNGLSFSVNQDVSVPGSNFTSGGDCKDDGYVEGVAVTAVNGGDDYNLSEGRTYASSLGSSVYGIGSAMGGGTDNIVTAVSQADCDNAKNELLSTKTDDYKNQLSAQISSEGMLPIRDTFAVEAGDFSCNPPVGAEATQSTATLVLNLSMIGVNKTGLDQLIMADVNKQGITQSVLDTGLQEAVITFKERPNSDSVTFNLQTNAKTGIQQDAESIANMIAGKKYGESLSTIKSQSGVADAKINYSPFWVTSTPKDLKRINVTFINQ